MCNRPHVCDPVRESLQEPRQIYSLAAEKLFIDEHDAVWSDESHVQVLRP
jgi:hypothetical protein